MKTIWSVLSILAMSHVLALSGFAGWLAMNDRLSGDRLERVRAMFAETVTTEQKRIKTEEAAQAQEAIDAAELEKQALPTYDSAQRVTEMLEANELMQERLRRMQRDMDDLKRSLSGERSRLDQERDAFAEEKTAFDDMREQIRAREGDDQFAKALELYSTLKPDAAKAALSELVQQGELPQVVEYLNQMDATQAAKIVAVFIKDDEAGVASELLERLRVRGIEIYGPEAPGS